MSTQYPGFDTIAVRYWKVFLTASVGMATLLLFTGAVGALLVLTIAPGAWWLFGIAAAGFALHSGALYLRDVGRGAYEPGQTTFASGIEMFALIVILGFVESTMLVIGTVSGVFVAEFATLPMFVAILAAAYYPVVDLVLLRRGLPTPGAVVMTATSMLLATILNLHKSRFETLPVFGRKKRPQS